MKEGGNITKDGGICVKIHYFVHIGEKIGENQTSKVGKVGVELVEMGTVVGVDEVGEILCFDNLLEVDKVGFVISKGFFANIMEMNRRRRMFLDRFYRSFHSPFIGIIRRKHNMDGFFSRQ